MPNPFEKRKTPPVVRETTVTEAVPTEEPEEVEEVEELEEPEGDLLDPAKVLYSTNHCNSCEYFVAEGEPCQKVSGDISGDGWCVLHTAKAEPMMEEEVME